IERTSRRVERAQPHRNEWQHIGRCRGRGARLGTGPALRADRSPSPARRRASPPRGRPRRSLGQPRFARKGRLMIFKRAVQRYGRTPEPETPYQRAGQLWDERIGAARVQAKNWRLMAFGCLSLACGLAGGLVWQSMQSRVTPYVIEVDRPCEARAASEAEAGYRPSDPQIAWHLARFISNVRSVSLDPVLMRRDWLQAYDFTTRRGSRFLDDYASAASPFADLGERTVSVQVTSV